MQTVRVTAPKQRGLVNWKDNKVLVDAINAIGPAMTHGQVPGARYPQGVIHCRIVSSSQDYGNYRWTYTLQRVYRAGAGFDSWQDDTDFPQVDTGYNDVEENNGDSSDPGNWLSGYKMSAETSAGITPIQNKEIVQCVEVYCLDEDGNPVVEYHFSRQNDLAVDCATASGS